MARSVVGLDIGGANLKAAHVSGKACLQPFALWRNPAGLPEALRRLLRLLPPFDQLAVTMTGELCDCFATRREGVLAILDAVEAVAKITPTRIWLTTGRFAALPEVRRDPLQAAAANWLALAAYVGRFAPKGCALLVDIGSTTTDLVPLAEGKPIPRARVDSERLHSRELIYTGVRRTPVCALLGADGAAELFATTLDVYLTLAKLPDDETDRDTADGKPATRAHAHARLARMLCADVETTTDDERRNLALRICHRQALLIRQGMDRVAQDLPSIPAAVILSGSGEFLARAALELPPDVPGRLAPLHNAISLKERHTPEISRAACAYALAVLASEAPDEF